MSTSIYPYGRLVPSNVEELILACWDGYRVRASGSVEQDGCLARALSSEFWGQCELSGGPWGQICCLCHGPQPVPCHWGAPEGKGMPWEDHVPLFPQVGVLGRVLGLQSGDPPPPPNLHLKLSFPSFVLPTGMSLSPPRAPSAALAVQRVVWRGPAGLRPAHPVPPIATAAWRSPPPPPPASPASPPTTPASSPRTPLTPNHRPPCPRTSPARYREGQRHQPPPRASVSPSVEWVGAAGCNTRVCLVQRW